MVLLCLCQLNLIRFFSKYCFTMFGWLVLFYWLYNKTRGTTHNFTGNHYWFLHRLHDCIGIHWSFWAAGASIGIFLTRRPPRYEVPLTTNAAANPKKLFGCFARAMKNFGSTPTPIPTEILSCPVGPSLCETPHYLWTCAFRMVTIPQMLPSTRSMPIGASRTLPKRDIHLSITERKIWNNSIATWRLLNIHYLLTEPYGMKFMVPERQKLLYAWYFLRNKD